MNMTIRKSLLDNGHIPAKTECPFRSGCGVAKCELCDHKGINHEIHYSCGLARAFDLIGKKV